MDIKWKKYSVLPGFGPSFAATVVWLGILVLLPLSTLVVNTLAIGFEEMPYRVISDGASICARAIRTTRRSRLRTPIFLRRQSPPSRTERQPKCRQPKWSSRR